jgi:hypothetical protein
MFSLKSLSAGRQSPSVVAIALRRLDLVGVAAA